MPGGGLAGAAAWVGVDEVCFADGEGGGGDEFEGDGVVLCGAASMDDPGLDRATHDKRLGTCAGFATFGVAPRDDGTPAEATSSAGRSAFASIQAEP